MTGIAFRGIGSGIIGRDLSRTLYGNSFMSLPPFRSALVALSLALVAGAAPAASATSGAKPHKAGGSAPALIVRGDQVSTEGLVDAVARAFAQTGEGRLEVQPFNTIDGIDKALSGQVDLAASARPAYARRPQEAGLTFTPVAWDALVLITNAANPVNNLTLKQVHDIYYGKVKNWSQVGGPDEPIDLDGVASPLDGTQFSFRRLMFGNGANPVAVPRLFINIDSLQQEVSLDRKALALSTLVHVRRQEGIKAISIEGIQPTVTSVASGQYPLPLTIYLAYRPDSPKIDLIHKFLAFLGGPRASEILRRHDLLPYAQATVLNATSEQDRINTVGAYMVAEGLPPEYAPGNEFARLAGNPKEISRAAALQQAAANVVKKQRAAAAQAAAMAPPPPPATYTVKKGDTLSRIAERRSVSVEDLRKWNNLHSDMLQVGQVLEVSSPGAAAGGASCTSGATAC